MRLRGILGALAACSSLASAQAPAPQSRANAAQEHAAPAMATYTKELLFGEVWARQQLQPRDRSLITLAALIATGGNADRMRSHLELALKNGVEPREISGLITHLAFYTGWPNSVGAAEVAADVFKQHGIAADRVAPSGRLLPAQIETDRLAEVNRQFGDFAPALAKYTGERVYGELWRNSDLSPRDRSIVTIAALIAAPDQAQLPSEIRHGIGNGVTPAELGEMVTHLMFYIGWPKAMAGAAIARQIVDEQSSERRKADPAPAGMRIDRADMQPPQRGSSDHFTGIVMVGSSFRAAAPGQYHGATVSFQPGARTHWHSHASGQMLVIVSGRGLVQAEGGPVQEVGPGDVIWTPPRVRHWHGAAPDSAMAHIGISDSENVTWAGQVTDQQYRQPVAPRQ